MNPIVEKLSQYEEFKNLIPKINEDINKKGYSIFQILSNEDIIRAIKNYEISPFVSANKDTVFNIIKFQDKTTIVLFKNSIFFNKKFFEIDRVEEFYKSLKNISSRIKNKIFLGKKFFKYDNYTKSIKYEKIDSKPILNFINYIFLFFLILVISFFVSLIIMLMIAILLNLLNIKVEGNLRVGLYVICLSFPMIFLLYQNFFKKLSFSITKRLDSVREIYNSTQKTNFLYQLKSIDDDITSIENLNLGKINLLDSFDSDFSSLKNYENLTSQISNLLVSITPKLQNFNSDNINKSEILSFATQNFDIVLRNRISVLSNIQNEISKVNSEAKSENQKLFSKTTDNLNINIGAAINQLQSLKI